MKFSHIISAALLFNAMCASESVTWFQFTPKLEPEHSPDEPRSPPREDEGDLQQSQLQLLITAEPIVMDTKPSPTQDEGFTAKKPGLHDKTTTFTGQPITINVLSNDFSYDLSQQGSSEDGGLESGSSLVLHAIVTNGIHGTCVIDDDSILYTPDAGYAGTDKCGYQVCKMDDMKSCVFASISLTITKQVEEVEVNHDPHPTANSDDVGAEASPPLSQNEWEVPQLIDPEALLIEEVWDEVDQSAMVDETSGEVEEGESSFEVEVIPPVLEVIPPVLEVIPPVVEVIPPAENDTWEEFTSDCGEEEVLITVELQTDFYGDDVTWELLRGYNDDSNPTVEISGGPYGYGQHSFDQVDLCAPSPSLYTFNIYDVWGDGLCNTKGCGYYKLFLNGREIVHVNHYAKNNTHLINVGYDPTPSMTQREVEYLHAHNTRRQTWHEMYNVSYVPLFWSPKLAEESLRWAHELLAACDSDGIEHEPMVPEGENLAKNKGIVNENGLGFGQLYPPENIVKRWVDREIGWAYPDNAHLTQTLWRAGKYLGCGESEKDYNGGKCRVQVCRYAKAGNCNMKTYNSTEGENWLVPMLKVLANLAVPQRDVSDTGNRNQR
ncbi:hypothetical protein ACHAXR_008248 [Thalassiosira sp. AJA248-18]